MGLSCSHGPKVEYTAVFPIDSSYPTPEARAVDFFRNTILTLAVVSNFRGTFAPALEIADKQLELADDFLNPRLEAAFVRTGINLSLVEESTLHELFEELNTVRDSVRALDYLDNTGNTPSSLDTIGRNHLISALTKTKSLLERFKDSRHLFGRCPVVMMPYFAILTNVFKVLGTMAAKLDNRHIMSSSPSQVPNLASLTWVESYIITLPSMIRLQVRRFLSSRARNIHSTSCKSSLFIVDEPWLGYWYSGRRGMNPESCNICSNSNCREDSRLKTYGCNEHRSEPTLNYKADLTVRYKTLFRKMFVTDF